MDVLLANLERALRRTHTDPTLVGPKAYNHLFCSHPGAEPTVSCAYGWGAFAAAVSAMLVERG